MNWAGWRQRRPRLAGEPPSANGASSFHLWWALPHPGPYLELSVVLQVQTPPSVPRLYFWALQASFVEAGRELGAGHTGLQWHPAAPEGAVNWGGYGQDGKELAGTRSQLPAVDGPNTLHFAWQPGRPYRFRISQVAKGAWRSEVTDLATGATTALRELFVPASALASPVVWSEVFARCEDPPTEARWSELSALDLEGRPLLATSGRPTYQSHEDGGCANTETRAGPGYFVQVTGLDRPRGPAPELLALPG